jgi:hypothetical protein
MRLRFEQFSLALRPEKTRLLEFGRMAAVNEPKTFAFLGFTSSAGNLVEVPSSYSGRPGGTACG